MLRNAKVDLNHPQIVKELRDKGYQVKSLAQLKNCCDLLVYDGVRLGLFEVKSNLNIKKYPYPERVQFMTDGEKRFAEDFVVWVVVDSEEIIEIMKKL